MPVLRAPRMPMAMERITVAEPQHGEVRVRMVASGVCHSCLHTADGSHTTAPLPIVLGDEGAGVVEQVGPGCTAVQPGDHVVLSWAPGCGRCRACRAGRPVICRRTPPFGALEDGTTRFRDGGGAAVHHYGPATYAPLAVVAERAAIPIRRDMPLETAALIGCSVTTGIGAVASRAEVDLGQSVAVFGCGGVGLNAVQGAVLVGADPVVAIDVVDERLAQARRMGATLLIDARRCDPVTEVHRLLGVGVDHAIAAVGVTAVIEQAIASTAPGGTCVVVGNPPTGSSLEVSPHHILGGERQIVGCVYGSWDPALAFPTLVDLYLAGRVQLDDLVTRRYALEEANEAFDDLAAGRVARGLIVFPAPEAGGAQRSAHPPSTFST